MTKSVAYVEGNYSNFNALKFCKQLSIINKPGAVSKFESCVSAIAKRSVKTKGADKDLIKWARNHNKATIDSLFATSAVAQYFYDENRKVLALKEKTHYVKALGSSIDDLDADIDKVQGKEDDKNEAELDNNEDQVDGGAAATSPTDATSPRDATSPENAAGEGHNEDHESTYIRDLKNNFQETYRRMDNTKKLYLSTGKCVEDEIYCFAKKYHVFSDEELNEIEDFNEKPTPEMPIPLRDYLNQFNKTTTADIRKEIFRPMEFDDNYNPQTHYYYDWIRSSSYRLLMEYEAGSFLVPHHEEWGEVSSSSSSCRKNQDRHCNSVDLSRKKLGTKCDMIFKDAMAFTEYGASETGMKFEGENGSKLINEGFLKLPKTLKDMLDFLYLNYPHAPIDRLETIGYIHAGLFSQVLRVDRPSPYITRITRLQPATISPHVSLFGASVLSCLHITYIVGQIVKYVQDICNDVATSSTSQDSSWLTTRVKRRHQAALTPFPKTSTSDSTKRRKSQFL
ncbi:hypothetical protein MAM1_0250c08735 [Mucor ambiguus]|uniref:Uncharacterized protein n=1 Tax=Mucor ambiguus TaxID=91626 RepID=A0A0C9N3Q5_9FUNG|nr:hypothetical protein MAM1_0250c08735 [Mucor ambiguus]